MYAIFNVEQLHFPEGSALLKPRYNSDFTATKISPVEIWNPTSMERCYSEASVSSTSYSNMKQFFGRPVSTTYASV